MDIAHLTSQQSTHALLYSILLSELGILSVAAPSTQIESIVLSFNHLKENLLQQLKTKQTTIHLPIPHPVEPVAINIRIEATLFQLLYSSPLPTDTHASSAIDVNTLNTRVYPLIATMLQQNPALLHSTHQLVQAHIQRYPAVAPRVEATLQAFGIPLFATYPIVPPCVLHGAAQ